LELDARRFLQRREKEETGENAQINQKDKFVLLHVYTKKQPFP
jgi:hypothetical protein